jgi:D-alanine-D-alanine ligase-like ATP-grasp enzyme
VTHALRALAASGAPGRAAAVRLESLRTVGLHSARRRLRQEARLRRLRQAGHKVAGYSAIWRDAADAVGADLDDLGGGFLRIRRAGTSTIVKGQAVMLDDAVTLRLADDKGVVHQLLRARGLSVAAQLAFDEADPTPAADFLEDCAAACFVKPAGNSGGGAGATGGVRERGDLLRAALKASRWSRRLLIERQAPGPVYRLLLLDGELLDVVRRRPPELVGDGRSTVADLVALENASRLNERSLVGSLLRLDLDAVLTLRESGLSPGSVPAAGRVFRVKSATSQNARRDNDTYRGELSTDLVGEARSAAAAIGVRLAGVDVVTPDAAVPLAASGGAIIEVNGEPGLQHHYEVADRARATPVAVAILERLLQAG